MSPRVLFEQELEMLRSKVTDMGERAQISFNCLLLAVKSGNREVLTQLLDNDRQMMEMLRSIEAKCLTLLTRQQPVARDLRTVSAALKVVTDIERIGDHVTDLAELFLRMEEGYSFTEREPKLAAMMEEAKNMLHKAVEAFVNGDIEAAQTVIEHDDIVDDYFNQVKDELIEAVRARKPDVEKIVDLLMIAKYLEKIGDHAVNIGEWACFQETGDIRQVRLL